MRGFHARRCYDLSAVRDSGAGRSSSTATTAGFAGGCAHSGFDFGMGKAKLFAEGRFHAIMKGVTDGCGDQKTAYMIPLTVGLRF